MRKLALIIRHAEPETLAENYTSALLERGFDLRPLNVFESAPEFQDRFDPPALEEVDLIIALGGPQSANDCYPALRLRASLPRRRDGLRRAGNGSVPGCSTHGQAHLAEKSDRPAATEFGLRKMWVTRDGSRDPVFGKLRVPLVPTLHGESFTVPAGATELAFGYMLCRDGKFRRAEPRLSIRRLLRVSVRAATHARRAGCLESGAGGRL